jgi:hypothetical protein
MPPANTSAMDEPASQVTVAAGTGKNVCEHYKMAGGGTAPPGAGRENAGPCGDAMGGTNSHVKLFRVEIFCI